ncbi:hypothetical protein THOD04_70337 [Vibrio owensii]|nr:hypothetical protein THOD04_70337 [Vibrio owensii]
MIPVFNIFVNIVIFMAHRCQEFMDEPYDIREVAAQFCAASRTFYGISGIHVSQRHHRRAIRLFVT